MVRDVCAALSTCAEAWGTASDSIKYNALIDAWAELINTLEIVLDRNRNNEERAASEGAEENAERCQSDLMTECEAWLR